MPTILPAAPRIQLPRRTWIRGHWRGRLPLLVSALFITIGAGVALTWGASLLIWVIAEGSTSSQQAAVAWLGIGAFLTLFWIWNLVGTWRSAAVHMDRGGSIFLATAVRMMVALGLLFIAVQSPRLIVQTAELASLAAGRDPLGPVAAMQPSGDGARIRIDGLLSSGAGMHFEQILNRTPHARIVELDSSGGRLLEARNIADLVRGRQLATHVEGECISACTLVLIAGVERSAIPDARIGFHQPRFPGLTAAGRRDAIDRMRQLYRQGGIADSFLEDVLDVPPEKIWYPPRARLVREGILNR